jgi:hypothetical protein
MPEEEFFAIMKFEGIRFNGKHIPVEVLPSISAYQETIIGIAKELWRDENPERNLPRGFDAHFELGLGPVGQGSKIARLPRLEQGTGLLGFGEYDSIFLEAQKSLTKMIRAANCNENFAPLPEKAILSFEKIRKSLSSDESLKINPIANKADGLNEYDLSEFISSKIVNFSRYREEKLLEDVGFIIGISETPSVIKVVCKHGVFSYPMSWSDLRVNSDFKLGSIVSFLIKAEVDRESRITGFLKAESISLVPVTSATTSVLTRIDALGALEDGWLDGIGYKPNYEALLRGKELSLYLTNIVERL